MARIILAGYMFRYPLGGMLSNTLQYLIGLIKLGHDVYFVEKSGWLNSCFDPVKNVMTDDCSHGISIVKSLLGRFGLEENWCYVDQDGNYFGCSERKVKELFRSADLFVDYGSHGLWQEESQTAGKTVLIDGEPGMTQMKWEIRLQEGQCLPDYDFYFTVGQNIGQNGCTIPTLGKKWTPIFHPVDTTSIHSSTIAPTGSSAMTTVMNWQAHEPFSYSEKMYGQKDVEFEKFILLPQHSPIPLEVAVTGKNTPMDRLNRNGWKIKDAHEVTLSYDSYWDYIHSSRGEFSVCKQVFVDTQSGWFSDRSAAYLAAGKPVILQETGFSEHLPCGAGLFAVKNIEEALDALEIIESDYDNQKRSATEIAKHYLDSQIVSKTLLAKVGL